MSVCKCCNGPEASVPIGAGMLICFRCFVRLLYPNALPPTPEPHDAGKPGGGR